MKNIYSTVIFLAMALLVACTGIDHYYQDMIKDGPTIYPGRVAGVHALAGKNRIKFSMATFPDPTVEKVWVKWTYRGVTDSLSAEVTRGREFNTAEILLENLEEDHYTFYFTTVDSEGHKSVPFEIPANIYGENYQNAIQNIFVREASYEDEVLTLELSTSSDSVALGSVFYYTGIDGESKSLFVENGEETIEIEDYKSGSSLTYQSLFVPQSHAIDTFYTDNLALSVLTVLPLKNKAVPFQYADRNGRWGTLADWTTNDAIKVHNGHGGWDEWNSNIFNVESGWGAPAIENGKIYQTFDLGPGEYTFEISDLKNTNLTQDGDKTYLVAAIGDDIPDVEAVESSLSYAQIYQGRPAEQFKVVFTLEENTRVSVGYLTTQSGGTPGRYCNILGFNFYYYPD